MKKGEGLGCNWHDVWLGYLFPKGTWTGLRIAKEPKTPALLQERALHQQNGSNTADHRALPLLGVGVMVGNRNPTRLRPDERV